MNNQPRPARGRHAKPPSELSVRCDRAIAATLRGLHGQGRRKLAVLGTGTASVALLAVAGVAGFSATGQDKPPKKAAAAQRARPPAQTSPMADVADADPDAVPDAVTYFKVKDPGQKVAKHVKNVRRSGAFLRVYTDLPEGDENSQPAIALCEWTAEYLQKQAGEGEPIVFVHAKENDNGNVVLANKQSAGDDCKVSDTP